jgi:hypothetical protein
MTPEDQETTLSVKHRWKGKLPLVVLGGLVFFLHLIVTGGHLLSPDEELLFRTSESIAFRGTTQILPIEANPVSGQLIPGISPDQTFATRWSQEKEAFYAQYLPLQPLLAAPFLWTSRLFEGALSEPFVEPLAPSMTMLYINNLPPNIYARAAFRRGFVSMMFNPLIAAITALMLARLGRLLTGSRRAGIFAAALWAFGTVSWPHSRSFFTEPLAGLLAFLAVDQLIRWYLSPINKGKNHAILAGFFLALCNWTRVDGPFFTMGLTFAMIALAIWKYLRSESYGKTTTQFPISDIIKMGGIATMAWLFLQYFNEMRFGMDLTSGYSDQSEGVKFSNPLLIGLHGLLFSPGKGMFYFSPALILGIWGWMRTPHHLKWAKWLVIGGYLPFFIAMVKWQNWDGGWCWGPRHIIQMNIPIMLGAVFLYCGHISIKRWIATVVIFIPAVCVQLYGSSQNPLDYYKEYFQTYDDLEYHKVNLRGIQMGDVMRNFAFYEKTSEGKISRQISPQHFPAPMIDSLYLPQHTQWASYNRMWQFGYCDWYFWNACFGNKSPDRWSPEP